jgi:hypothetical protein
VITGGVRVELARLRWLQRNREWARRCRVPVAAWDAPALCECQRLPCECARLFEGMSTRG